MVQRKTNKRTKITGVQRSFESEFYHRLIRSRPDSTRQPLALAIREKVVDQDALGLTTIRLSYSHETAQLDFDFPENPALAAEFEDWLQRQIDRNVLERANRGDVVDGRHYTAEYIRQASQQGVKHADRELSRAGVGEVVPDDSVSAVLRTPIHEDIMASAYRRAYDELEGISGDMATEISRVMSDSLADGVNPRETARRMTERVDVGLTRSRRIARTETSRTYSNHSIARYSDLGVTEVEILTSNPCDKCASLAAGDPYPVEEAFNLIPDKTHPNCVCSPAPRVQSMTSVSV